MQKECIDFLIKYGWVEDIEFNDNNIITSEYRHFCKENQCCIEIDDEEIVFIDDNGDFLHINIDKYALIGVLVTYRMIPYNY